MVINIKHLVLEWVRKSKVYSFFLDKTSLGFYFLTIEKDKIIIGISKLKQIMELLPLHIKYKHLWSMNKGR